jgi:hypothetical protein
MYSFVSANGPQPDRIPVDFPASSPVTTTPGTITTTTTNTAATTVTTTITTDTATAAQPMLRAEPAQASPLLATADRSRTGPDAHLLGHYVDSLQEAFDRGETDADTIMQAALVVRNVVARDVRHALPAMYGAARAMKKEQVLMYAFNFGIAWHHGNNALCYAAQMGHANAVKDLCALGVSLESRNPENRRTPLIIAAKEGHDKVVGILLAHGAATDAVDIDGMTALAHARQWLARGRALFNSSMHDPELGMNWAACVRLLEQARMATS